MEHYFGYLILAAYALVLLVIWRWVKQAYPRRADSVNEFIFAGRQVPVWLAAASVFSAWVWVTTLIGSAEACVLYGVSGAIGYTAGATIAFIVFLLMILAIFRLMPESPDFIAFLGERFTDQVKWAYYLFSLFTIVYVAVEQAAGIGFVINGFYQTSYQRITFLVVIVAVVFVIFAGARGVLWGSGLSAMAIGLGFLVMVALLCRRFDLAQVAADVSALAKTEATTQLAPDLLNVVSAAGIRYFLLAIIVALGQILYDPGYYHKAYMVKGRREIKQAFLLGGVLLWCPVGLISAFLLGFIAIAQDYDFSSSLNISADLATELLSDTFGPPVILLFAALILVIGITTISHYLSGIQAMFTVDFYPWQIKKNGSDREKIRFGQLVTALVGICCALVATALENISLLTIDTFSGVFFAAPCGAFFASVLSKKELKNLPLYSIFLGLGAGFYVWVFADAGRELGAFYGTVTSFVVPILFLAAASFFVEEQFNFTRLKFWRGE